MKTYSKRKRLIKGLKYLSVAGSIFALSVIKSDENSASASMFSKFWQRFKSSMSSFGSSVRARFSGPQRPFSVARLVSESNGNSSSWKDPFRKLAKRFRGSGDKTQSSSKPVTLSDGTIYHELKGDPPYKTPRARRLGSLPSVIFDDDGSGDSIPTPPIKNKPVYDNIFDIVTSDGEIKKVVVTQKTGDLPKNFPTSTLVRKNLTESNGPVNNFEVIYSGNGTQSTFNPNNEAKLRTTRDQVVRGILKSRRNK